jgi:hypothetical protein
MVVALSDAAFFGDIFVGALSCRVEATAEGEKLYVMTLGVLSPYRHLKIGTRTLSARCAALRA